MKRCFAVFLAVGVLLFFRVGALRAAAVSYELPPIEGIGLAPFLEIVTLPISSEGSGEFTRDSYECYAFEGSYYYVLGSGFREASQPWDTAEEMLLAASGLDALPFHSYAELRELRPAGVYGDGETGRIRRVLYRIGDDLLLATSYAFNYSVLTGKITYTVPPERIEYTLCARVPEERILRNQWTAYRGNPRYAYAGADGQAVTGIRMIDGICYDFGEYGVCQGEYTGFTRSDKGRRYRKEGVLVKNRWIRVGGERKYYAGADGYFVTGTREIGGTEYTFGEDGALLPAA